MKFQIQDKIVNDYQSAFEVIKDKIYSTLKELNKLDVLNIIKPQQVNYNYYTDGLTLYIKSAMPQELNDKDDNTIVASINILVKGQKPQKFDIIKNPKTNKKKKDDLE